MDKLNSRVVLSLYGNNSVYIIISVSRRSKILTGGTVTSNGSQVIFGVKIMKVKITLVMCVLAGLFLLGVLHTTARNAQAMQEYEALKVLVAEIEMDINKAEGGNKAAGKRVLQQMRKIKQAAQVVRKRILEMRHAQ